MFKSWRDEAAVWMFLRLVIGLLWIYFGGEKLLRLPSFAEDVGNYQIVVEPWTTALAYLVPWLEIIIGVCFMLKVAYLGALAVNAGLLFIFIGALAQAWARGLEISCGCTPWAAQESTNYPLGIAVNIALIVISALLAVVEIRRPRHRFRGRKLKLS